MNRFPYFFWPNCGYNWWPSTHLYKQRFSSVQSLDRLDRLGDRTDDSAEILLQSFLQEALVSSSGMDRNVRFLRCCPSSISSANHGVATLQSALKDNFEEAVVKCDMSEYAGFRFLTVARRGFCGSTRKLILLCIQSLVLCST